MTETASMATSVAPAGPSAPVIAVKGVTRTFGEKVAVRDLNLEVGQGEVCGFIGPNGAGKTTTIRMIMSILFPDRGEISVLGHGSALQAKDRIGYLPEERGLYKKMKVASFLRYMARLKGVHDAGLAARIRNWLERVGLGETAGKKCEDLSKGMQQKLQFLAAVIPQPDLLILDEPFSGLDPLNLRLLKNLILEEHRRGASIIFSTHVMTQAEQICNRVVMIDQGRKVLDESLRRIRERFDPRTVLLEPLEPAWDGEGLKELPAVSSLVKESGEWRIRLKKGCDPASVMAGIVAAVPPARLELYRPTLEDIFLRIVEGEAP
ncbi:MAG: ABC transporter ATP-binding protein [Acidobacteriota bacterium]